MSLVAVTPVGSGQPDSSAASTPDLVLAVGVDADQFHVVAADDRVQRPPADVAGGPLDDAKGPVKGPHAKQPYMCVPPSTRTSVPVTK